MAGLVYYAPGRERALTTADAREHLLRELDLEYLGAQSLQSRHVLSHGPDGKSGIVFTSNTTARLGYYHGEQTWVPGPEGKYWIGWATDNPPVPADLARETLLPGIELTLGDGNVWQIPRAQHWDGQTHLPTVYRLGKDGVQADVIPALKPFQTAVQAFLAEWKAALEDGRVPDCGEDQLFDLAGLALSLNYRIGRWEALALGLLQSQSYGGRAGLWDIGLATFDWPAVAAALDEFAKKNASEAPGDSGSVDYSQDIGQPQETCS
jgi:hypothetical protein